MPTDIENLTARRSSILAEIAAIVPGASGGKPTYSIDGQSIDHTAYRMSLYQELDAIERRLAMLQGPFEIVERGST